MVYRKVRPQKHEKPQRNTAIIEYRHAHPEATLKDIGCVFGVSEGRVWQIIQREVGNGTQS